MPEFAVRSLKSKKNNLAYLALTILLSASALFAWISFYSSDTSPFSRNISFIDHDHWMLFLYVGASILAIQFGGGIIRLMLIGMPLIFGLLIHVQLFDFLSSVLHLLSVYCLGHLFSKSFEEKPDFVTNIFVGINFYILFLGVLSIFSALTELNLILLAVTIIVIAGFSFFLGEVSFNQNILVCLKSKEFSIIVLLCSIAVFRSAATLSHDPNWYSFGWLRNLSSNNIWASDGYINAVHLYGKVHEAGMGWLSFRDSPFSEIFFSMFVMLSAVWFALKKFEINLNSIAFVMLILLVGTPAFLGLASNGKADGIPLAALLITQVILITSSHKKYFPLLLVCIFIFLTSKPTYFIWGGIVCLLYINKIFCFDLLRRHFSSLVLCILGVMVLWFRTYVNSGYFYAALSPIIQLQNLIGLTPINNMVNVDLGTLSLKVGSFLNKMHSHFVDPGSRGNLSLSWTGLSIFPGLFFTIVLFKNYNFADKLRILFIVCLLIVIVGFTKSPSPTLDGYYIFPAISFILLMLCKTELFQTNANTLETKFTSLALIFLSFAICVLSIYYTDWRVPLTKSDFMKLTTSSYNESRDKALKYNDLTEISKLIESDVNNCKTFVSTSNYRILPILNTLICPVEFEGSVRWKPPLSRGLFTDEEVTENFLQFSKNEFVLIGISPTKKTLSEEYFEKSISYREVFKNSRWLLYQLSSEQ